MELHSYGSANPKWNISSGSGIIHGVYHQGDPVLNKVNTEVNATVGSHNGSFVIISTLRITGSVANNGTTCTLQCTTDLVAIDTTVMIQGNEVCKPLISCMAQHFIKLFLCRSAFCSQPC